MIGSYFHFQLNGPLMELPLQPQRGLMMLEYGISPPDLLCLDEAMLYTWTCAQQNKHDWNAYFVNARRDQNDIIYYRLILVRKIDD